MSTKVGNCCSVLVSGVVAMIASLSSPARGADLTLTKAFLDTHNGFIDFKQISHTLGPGDKVLIEGHTRPSLILVNLVYGAAGHPITVTNTGSQPFVIDGDDPSVQYGIGIWGAKHVVFTGTPLPDEPYGIKVLRASSVGIKVEYNNYQEGRVAGDFEDTVDLVISGVEIANAGFAGIQAKYELSEPYPDPVPTVVPLLDGLEIHHTYIHDVAGEGMYIGWTSDGHPDVANVSIHHNLIREAGWDGIQLNRSHGQNYIYCNVVDGYAGMSYTADKGLFGAQNEGITVHAAKTDVYDNLVKASNQYSGSALFYTLYEPSRVYNNVFVHGGFNSTKHEAAMYIRELSSGTLAAKPDATLDLINNTVIKPDSHGIELLGGVTKPVRIINNVIVEPLNGGRYVNVQSAQTPVTYATNGFYATVAEAGFVGPTDYHPASGSPLIDSGTNVASDGITADYEGVARPQGPAYDVGAYERPAAATAVAILTPAGWGTATGSEYCAATGAFDEQPTWDPVNQVPVGDSVAPHVDTTTAYANRYWYIDFGADWTKVRITGMWTRYRPSSGGTYSGFATLWWDDDADTVNDGIPATGLNFATAQDLPAVGAQQWVRDRAFTTPVTPAGRYLVIGTGPSPTSRANEFALVGYREP
jgi:hypothetical protein